MFVFCYFTGVGVVATADELATWWKRRTRGEFHCDKCGSITPLPTDDA